MSANISPVRIIQDFSREDLPGHLTSRVPSGGVIGIQGGQGSFNEQALHHLLRYKNLATVSVEYLYTSQNVAKALVSKAIDFGQCAISNSLGGEVQETMEILAQYPIEIVCAFEIQIAHAMMIRPDQDFSRITTLMCHPQVFAQCKRKLAEKYPGFEQVSGDGDLLDSARVAQALSERQLPDTVAVMGSRIFAEHYNLRVVEDNLQDLPDNYTRFILLKTHQ